MRAWLGCPCRARSGVGGAVPAGETGWVAPPAGAARQPGGGGWELLESEAARRWQRLTRRLTQILRLRRAWYELGEHLKQYRELRPRSDRQRAAARRR